MESAPSLLQDMSVDPALETLKFKLQVNAGRLAEPLLRAGKEPIEDTECHQAFLMIRNRRLSKP